MRLLLMMGLAMSLLLSCQQNHDDEGRLDSEEKVFFDVKSLVEADIRYLDSMQCKAFKKGRINDKAAENQVDTIRWKNELETIASADINKKSWVSFFTTDSSMSGDTTLIRYTAQKTSIPIRQLNISKVGEKVTEIYIVRKSSNLIFSSEQTILYKPRVSYTATGSQKALFLRDKTFTISSNFNCP